MRVLVNGLAATGTKTGIGHYTTQLVRCLHQQAGRDAIGYFPGPWLRQARSLWASVRSHLDRRVTSPDEDAPDSEGPTDRSSWRGQAALWVRSSAQSLLTRRFRAAYQAGGYDLYHEPNYIPLSCDLPTVATLHDLSVLLHPEWHPLDRVVHFEKHFRAGLAQCLHFLAISEFGRQEILRTLNLRPDQVTRTYMGIRPGLFPLPRAAVQQALDQLGLPPRYLLYLGTIEPRKNLLTLLRAYCSLPSSLRDQYPLLLVGNWGWHAGDIAGFLDQNGRSGRVIHLGYVPEEQLGVVYNGARALVYPSLYEGFGLPPVEMLACGGAVLASTAGALVETVGSQAHLIDPLDIDGWRSALARVLTDDDWWHQLRRGAVEAARPYTWEQCAADTLQVYRALTTPAESSSFRRAG